MEILLGIAVVFVLALLFGQMSLNKPVASWSDEELVRRLPKYQNVLAAEMQAGQWDKTKATKAKIDEIQAEMVKRQKAFTAEQAAPLKRDSLFSEKADGNFITEKAIAAAEGGDVELQVLVGMAYLSGANGLPQSPPKAAHFLQMAADQGHALASFVLAGMYADGLGVPQDLDSARALALKAKAAGAPDAEQMLAAIDSKRQ